MAFIMKMAVGKTTKKPQPKGNPDTTVMDVKTMRAQADARRKSPTNIMITQYLLKMNGKDIVNSVNVTSNPKFNSAIPFDELIYMTIKPELEKLENADNYNINLRNMIVDEKGRHCVL